MPWLLLQISSALDVPRLGLVLVGVPGDASFVFSFVFSFSFSFSFSFFFGFGY